MTQLVPRLFLDRVSISYGHHAVVAEVNLSVEAGEIVCLVGGSGSGKTTLLQAIGGLLDVEITRGRIEVDGVGIKGPGPDRAMVFQDDAVFPWYTVEQNVEYSLKLRRVHIEQRKEVAGVYLNMVGLTHVGQQYPRELSGGMRKRVDLARALAAEPRVMLMDEPFAALDAITKSRLQADFLSVSEREHVTSIFVTHDLEEALYIGDRVAILGGNPATISNNVVTVPFEHPRPAAVRFRPEFQRLRSLLEGELAAQLA